MDNKQTYDIMAFLIMFLAAMISLFIIGHKGIRSIRYVEESSENISATCSQTKYWVTSTSLCVHTLS